MKTQHQSFSSEKFAGLQRSLSRVLPWLSLVWGIVSGFLISRDSAHNLRFLIFSGALLVFSGLVSLWFLWRQRLEAANLSPERGLAGLLHARAGLVEWVVLTGTQIYAQYIFMFSIPLLFFSKSWVVLVLTLLGVASSLWDPWWMRLVKSEWYRTALRTLAVLLAASFFFALFLAPYLKYYRFYLIFVALLTVFPWHLAMRWRAFTFKKFLPFLSVIMVVAVPIFLFERLPLPLLAVWLQEGRFAQGADPKNLAARVVSPVSRSKLKQILDGEGQLCCLSPVVAPQGFEAEISQEWYVDGRKIDTISLPPLRGSAGEKSFRTYSCKKNLIKMQNWQEIKCVTVLAHSFELGAVHLSPAAESSSAVLPEPQ